MVQEVRRIILGKEEVVTALTTHGSTIANFLPEGKVVDYEVIDQRNIMVMVATDPAGQEASVICNDHRLLQILIRFCLDSGIMLPRQGHKSVSIAKDNVSLYINFEFEVSAVRKPMAAKAETPLASLATMAQRYSMIAV